MNLITETEAMSDKITELTGLSQEELFETKVNSAVDFLWDWIGKEDQVSIQIMMQSTHFWIWWLQTWLNFDKWFISTIYYTQGIDKELLKPLIKESYFYSLSIRDKHQPNRVVMESYHKMIKEHSKVNQL